MADKITNIVLMRHGNALSKHESGVSYDSDMKKVRKFILQNLFNGKFRF